MYSQSKHYLFYVAILCLLAYAAYGALELSLTDYRHKDVCPKLFGIPACYLVFLSFAMLFFLQIFRIRKLYFYLVLAFPLLLALVASVMELAGIEVCPRNAGGTPMCYFSLLLCGLILILKMLQLRPQKQNKIVV